MTVALIAARVEEKHKLEPKNQMEQWTEAINSIGESLRDLLQLYRDEERRARDLRARAKAAGKIIGVQAAIARVETLRRKNSGE